MGKGIIFCEFCGAVASRNCDDPAALIRWTHSEKRDVVRCATHRKTSKYAANCRTYDPYTGRRLGDGGE